MCQVCDRRRVDVVLGWLCGSDWKCLSRSERIAAEAEDASAVSCPLILLIEGAREGWAAFTATNPVCALAGGVAVCG